LDNITAAPCSKLGQGADKEAKYMRDNTITTAGDNNLVNLSDVSTNKEFPRSSRVAEYNRQIKDPGHYWCQGFKITAIHPSTAPLLEECLQGLAK
jgi:hypothetical protein